MESAQKPKSGAGLGAVIVPLLTFVVGFAAGHLVADWTETTPKVKVDPSTPRAQLTEPRDSEVAPTEEATPAEDGDPETDEQDANPGDAEDQAEDGETENAGGEN